MQSRIPLLVAVDGEWGPAMRIDSITTFPYAQAIGAVQDSAIIYQMGRDMAAQLKLLGIHMNFGPVADINTNPSNPVINFRSYGENKLNVAQKAWWVASGMMDASVIPVAKHFPGHGDTDTDSHKTLPYLSHSKERMDTLETYPFRYLAKKGISGIMSAHLNVPSLDNTETPSSLSKAIISDYLKEEIGFTGFVVTDAINMQGVRTEKGNAEVEALKAGNDILEFVPDIESAIESVKQALINNEISELEIYEKCRTMLALKRWVNLNKYQPTDLTNLTEKLNSPLFEVTNRKLVKGSMTVLKNNGILPLEHLDSFKIASVMIGSNEISKFQKMLSNYTQIDHYFLPQNASEQDWLDVKNRLKNYNLVIGGVTGINKYPSGKYGITAIQGKAVSEIIQQNNSVFTFFGNAYAIKHLANIHNANGVILAYQNSELTQELAAQLIFGAYSASGKLTVTIDDRFKVDAGIQVNTNSGFSYTIPEEVGINSKMLNRKIDSIAMLGIDNEAYPGCQVLIAKDGNIILHKTYGYHTYDKRIPVKEDDLYDWASLTKVTGPLPAIMRLVDEKKMDINMPLSQYWPSFKNSNKEFLSLREILAHQAGLEPFIPFWQMALLDDEHLDPKVFLDQPNDDFNVRVSSHLYMNKNFRAVMYDTIRNSKLRPVKKYVYSDLAFILFPEVITRISGVQYENYLKETFYHPLGAYNITFNPYLNYSPDRIIPTEDDQLFRHETVLGFVHDEGAAMLGGISGNAGLFGTTADLAKIFQMYLQKGFFAGKRYISENTINEFIKIQFPENENRRGLGFDKPKIDNHKNDLDEAYPAPSSSKNSFGHTGFTGTLAWADPDNGLLFVFMSNRIYPTRENQMLYELNIRTGIHQSIYDCIKLGL
jgi:beta-glucosidase-like glycosyl hydrolase/CubicO group peptidase (beta-lactamase class C family)